MQKNLLIPLLTSSLILGLSITTPLQAAPYELIDLGTLGGTDNFSFAINNLDEVTGNSDGAIVPDDEIDDNNPPDVCTNTSGQSFNRVFCTHAYFYSNATLTDLGNLGDSRSYGFGINNSSTIVGYGIELIPDDDDDDTNDLPHERAFISFSGGQVEALPYPVEAALPDNVIAQQRALDISDDGKIVGYTLVYMKDAQDVEATNNKPYVYDYNTDTYTIIPVFSNEIDRSGTAYSINSSGKVAGWANSEEEHNPPHALLWDPATPDLSTDLGTLGGFTSEGRDINDNGIIVGITETSQVAADNEQLGFIYDPSLATPMIKIPEFSEHEDFKISKAYAINNHNQVVGSAQISSGFVRDNTAFLYDYNNDTLVNLNDMVDCSLNWELTLARDINDNGSITGTGMVNGEPHSFLLVPTGDTVATNCTELRKEQQKQEEDEIKGGSGSFGVLSLFFGSIILLWRRRR